MTSVFSWQNSFSLCPASFRTPRPNLPVTPGVSGEGNGKLFQCSCLENPGTERPGGLPSVGSHGVGHNWGASAAATSARCSSPSCFALQSLQWKGRLLWVLVIKGLVGLHRAIQLLLLQHYWSGHRLGLPWYWMVCLGNRQRSFCHFWDYIQYCISVSSVDSNGYSISFKGFLPTVVDIIVIWVKFTHSSPL